MTNKFPLQIAVVSEIRQYPPYTIPLSDVHANKKYIFLFGENNNRACSTSTADRDKQQAGAVNAERFEIAQHRL
jgi:hypothetical protein